MRFLFHAALAATLIVSDATHAATLGGTRTRASSGASSASDDDARYRHNEEAWRRIMASICAGCGGPGPKLEIKRKRPDITRLERQAGIGVPVPEPASRAETGAAPAKAEPGPVENKPVESPVAEHKTAESRPAEGKASGTPPAERRSGEARPALRTAQRGERPALRTRKAVRLARLRRVREQTRLAQLERRRQAARRVTRQAQTVPAAPLQRRVPSRPTIAVAVARGESVRPRQVAALMPGPLPRPFAPLRAHRIYAETRELALVDRARMIVCQCTIR